MVCRDADRPPVFEYHDNITWSLSRRYIIYYTVYIHKSIVNMLLLMICLYVVFLIDYAIYISILESMMYFANLSSLDAHVVRIKNILGKDCFLVG